MPQSPSSTVEILVTIAAKVSIDSIQFKAIRMFELITTAIPLFLSVFFSFAALANDSSAELSAGGLVFTHSNEVVLQSEHLDISPDTVRVRYQFVNATRQPVTLTIAFALPDIDLSTEDSYSIPYGDGANFLGFQTKVAGKPVNFTTHQRAFLEDKDVSDLLHNAGVNLLPVGPEHSRIPDLPEATRKQLLQQRLVVENGTDDLGKPRYEAAWTVKTAALRTQTFEPGRPVVVEHRYRPGLGVSLDTVLRKELRENPAVAAEVQRYRKDYCIGDEFLAKIDKLAEAAAAHNAKLQEQRITYVLRTGANWAGPIKNFKLTVDKKKPDRLVSFCADRIKVISPIVLEFTANDFTPDKDLKILIVGKF